MNGSYRKIIINTVSEKPTSIAVDPIHGLLFWSENGDTKRIRRASLSGTNRMTIVNKTEASINDITLDYEVCQSEMLIVYGFRFATLIFFLTTFFLNVILISEFTSPIFRFRIKFFTGAIFRVSTVFDMMGRKESCYCLKLSVILMELLSSIKIYIGLICK